MDLLLDTHTFIWFINGETLSPGIVEKIKDLNNKCFISIASIWEIAIKTSLGKLTIGAEFDSIKRFLSDTNIEILPISFEHIQQLTKMPRLHNDPFDRIIIAQAMTEQFVILSMDSKFDLYEVAVQWG